MTELSIAMVVRGLELSLGRGVRPRQPPASSSAVIATEASPARHTADPARRPKTTAFTAGSLSLSTTGQR